MEARAEFRQPRISKSLVAIVAVSIALGLGVMAGTVAKDLNGSATTATQTHAVVLGKGGPAVQSVRHGGMQTVEDNALGGKVFLGPDAQERNAKLAAPAAGPGFSPERGYREG